jgi:serine protease Do
MQTARWIREQKTLSFALLLATLALGIVIGTIIGGRADASRQQTAAPDAVPLTVPPLNRIEPNQFVELARRLEPSVVNISTEYTPKIARGRRERNNDEKEGDDQSGDLFRRFFGERNGVPPRAFRRSANGSGFVVDANGYVLTNWHVVEDADAIRVRFPNAENGYRARLVGHDEETDLAVLKVDVKRTLTPVRIANSDSVQVGDWAVAIGSPFGLEATVTAGIVSATGRDIAEAKQFQRFIQTDAAINPGNSGGPLLNIKGEVVGINTAIATSTGSYQGVGFALPINTAVSVYNSIIRAGKVSRGSIGIQFRNYDPAVLRGLGLDAGVVVASVNPGGPADRAGVKANDVIVAFNRNQIKDGDDLVSRVAATPIGEEALVSVDRDGKRLDLRVKIADRDEQVAAVFNRPGPAGGIPVPQESAPEEGPVRFGLRLRPPDGDERAASGVREGGLVVTEVDPGSFAEEVRLEEGDMILSINRQSVSSLSSIKSLQLKLKRGDAVAFRVMRPGRAAGGKVEYFNIYLGGTLE